MGDPLAAGSQQKGKGEIMSEVPAEVSHEVIRRIEGLNEANETQIKPFIQTYSGKAFWADAEPEMVETPDIANALSLNCRWAGHIHQFYSVAQHSCYMHDKLRERYSGDAQLLLWALMHDASEAYIADIPRPFKPLIEGYMDIEEKLMHVIAKRYGLHWPMPEMVKRYDGLILFDEAKMLQHPAVHGWDKMFAPGLSIHDIPEWSWRRAKREWVWRAYPLILEVSGQSENEWGDEFHELYRDEKHRRAAPIAWAIKRLFGGHLRWELF